MLELLRTRVARWIAPKAARLQKRMYASARPSRLAAMLSLSSSADHEIATSARALRSYSRQLCRDASFAKRAKIVVVNNVVGSGIGLQSQVKTTRGDQHASVNTAIEDAFEAWSCAEYCHTGGGLHFHDFERALMSEVFEAGEAFVRLHYRAFGDSKVPLALELIEAERLADDIQPGPASSGNFVRLGIEVDSFYRPVRYWFRERHPGEFQFSFPRVDRFEAVPASEIIHLRLVERWPQTRGVPWLHTVISKLRDMDGYSEAEIVAARGAASYVWWIKSPDDPASPIGEKQDDGSEEIVVEPGMTKRLAPGEEVIANTPSRPNTAMDPFMRMMLREVAAGVGTSYESLSRDYSQSNYSSSRLALLDDRDLWRVVQRWFIRSFRERLHTIWLQQAVLSGAVAGVPVDAYATDVRRYCAARFKPRGWTWIDPSSDLDAFEKAVRCGFTTVSQVITQTGEGLDLEDVLDAREEELKLMRAKGLIFDTDPLRDASGKAAAAKPAASNEPAAASGAPAAPAQEGDQKPQQSGAGRVVQLK